jgi:L,D-transpeptidase catalytic domain
VIGIVRKKARILGANRARRGWRLAVGALMLGALPGSIAGVVTAGGWWASPVAAVWQPTTTQGAAGGATTSFLDPWENLRLRTPVDLRACNQDTLIGAAVTEHVVARTAPEANAAVVARFDRRNVFGSGQVFLLDKEVVDGRGHRWYRALLPLRPNGTHGFVRADDLQLRTTSFRLDLNRSAFRLRLFDGCELLRSFRVGIGTGETPTPVGRFYINTLLKPPDPYTVYGTYAYGLSAYSPVLTYWKDGGFIGLHGTNEPSSIGHRSSHGCIRMLNGDIEKLVKILPLGTPITIH